VGRRSTCGLGGRACDTKNLSMRTWADVCAEVKQFQEKYSKDKKNEHWLDELSKHIDSAPEVFPFLAADMKKKDSEKVINMFKKICNTDLGAKFASLIVKLDTYMTALVVVDGLATALKSDDRVFFFTGLHLETVNVLGQFLGVQLEFTPQAASDPESDEVSDKELSAVVDGFFVKKAAAAKKKKKGKKKAGKGEKSDGKEKPKAAAAPAAADKVKAKTEKPEPTEDKGEKKGQAESKTTPAAAATPTAAPAAADSAKA